MEATCRHLQPLAAIRVAASGRKWPLHKGTGKWPQVAASCRKVAASGRWTKVGTSGRKWPQVAASGRKWPQVAASGKWPQVAASGRKRPLDKGRSKWPQVGAFPKIKNHIQSNPFAWSENMLKDMSEKDVRRYVRRNVTKNVSIERSLLNSRLVGA